MFETIISIREVPCSHRRFRHPAPACRIHGYTRDYTITLCGEATKGEVFPVDFKGLGWIEAEIRSHFDHTLLLDEGDPVLDRARALEDEFDFCRVVVLPSTSLEGVAEWIGLRIGEILACITDWKAWVKSVEVRESSTAAGRWTFCPGASKKF